jgi:hypothetical protein
MEEQRLEVTPEQIAEYFERAMEAIDGIPIDEMGHQEWGHKQARTWFVPSYHEPDERVEGDVMSEED